MSPGDRPLRANSAEVETVRRARCRIPGCGWAGPDRPSYQAANEDRQAHLDWHRLAKPAGEDGAP